MSIKFMAKIWLEIFVASKNPKVTCFGCQVVPKKWMSNAKMSCTPLDMSFIGQFKLAIANWHFTKASKTYNFYFFPTNLGSISYGNYFLKKKQWLDTNAYWNALTKHYQQTTKANDF